MPGSKIEKMFLGKLVKPKTTVNEQILSLFENDYGIISSVEWDEEERLLYIDILVKNKFINRKYRSVSMFQQFWEITVLD